MAPLASRPLVGVPPGPEITAACLKAVSWLIWWGKVANSSQIRSERNYLENGRSKSRISKLGHGSGIAQVVKEVKRQMRALGARLGECFIERGGLLRRQTNEEAELQELRERKAALKACHLPPQPRQTLASVRD